MDTYIVELIVAFEAVRSGQKGICFQLSGGNLVVNWGYYIHSEVLHGHIPPTLSRKGDYFAPSCTAALLGPITCP